MCKEKEDPVCRQDLKRVIPESRREKFLMALNDLSSEEFYNDNDLDYKLMIQSADNISEMKKIVGQFSESDTKTLVGVISDISNTLNNQDFSNFLDGFDTEDSYAISKFIINFVKDNLNVKDSIKLKGKLFKKDGEKILFCRTIIESEEKMLHFKLCNNLKPRLKKYMEILLKDIFEKELFVKEHNSDYIILNEDVVMEAIYKPEKGHLCKQCEVKQKYVSERFKCSEL